MAPVAPESTQREILGLGIGNTKMPRDSAALWWCWTLNNPEADAPAKWIEWLHGSASAYAFQLERGDEGTAHLQGVLCLKSKQRLTWLKKWCDKAHWEKTKRNEESIKYCQKKEGRIEGPWIHNVTNWNRTVQELTDEELWPWQREVRDIIMKEPDERTIHWFYDHEGGTGKSKLARYLVIKHRALCVAGAAKDMKHVVAKYCLSHAGAGPEIVILDIPRAKLNKMSYAGIEEVKNGLMCSEKFDSEMVVFNHPHVIIFANEEPKWHLASKDRWNVRRIEGKEAIRVPYPDVRLES